MVTRSPIGDVALGNYEPLLELASGGMATVYVARQIGAAGFERLVVIKRVHPHLLKDHEFHDMFRDEARVCSTIRHPNVVPVIDVVEAGGELFLVLEYVEGLALSALLEPVAGEGAHLEPPVVARIVADALSGLHAAHEAKDLRGDNLEVIHRDVSPQNVIVGRDGTSRIIDFGIAKAASRISITNSGVVKGKLRYMSPEQVQRKPLDRRADVFAAGVVLYEALTGHRPFEGDDDGDVVLSILIGEVPPPSSFVASLPAALDAAVAKALARNRDERFQTALEFQDALERAVTPATVREVARMVESIGGAAFELRRADVQAALEKRLGRDTPGSREPIAMLASPMRDAVPRGRSVRRNAGLLGAAAILGVAGALIAVFGKRTGAAARIETDPTPATQTPARIDPPDASSTSAGALAPSGLGTQLLSTPQAPHPSRRPDQVHFLPQPDIHRHNPYGTP